MAHIDADEALEALRGGSPSARRSAPHPHPSRGAGGPHPRAAGRVLPGSDRAAVVLEPDALLRPVVEAAVRRLGFIPVLVPAPVVFLDLGDFCGSISRGDGVTVIGFVAGRPLTAAAHALHGCCDAVMELRQGRDGPLLVTASVSSEVVAARLTPCEVDALALVLAGATDRRAAVLLGVAPSTVRSHVRAVLRKLGAADRALLRRRDVPSPSASAKGDVLRGPSGCAEIPRWTQGVCDARSLAEPQERRPHRPPFPRERGG